LLQDIRVHVKGHNRDFVVVGAQSRRFRELVENLFQLQDVRQIPSEHYQCIVCILKC
jgi:type III secretion system FlhB-like substrate exporter